MDITKVITQASHFCMEYRKCIFNSIELNNIPHHTILLVRILGLIYLFWVKRGFIIVMFFPLIDENDHIELWRDFYFDIVLIKIVYSLFGCKLT